MEEEIRTAETEQGDAVSNEAESGVEVPNNSPIKRGRGRPQGSKKLKVCVTDVNQAEPGSDISNGGPTQTPRRRGRPKLKKNTEQQGAEDDHDAQIQESKTQASNEDGPTTDHVPKKRGRPKKSLSKSISEKADAEGLPNGGSDTPKAKRGRPKGSTKRKSENLTSEQNEGSSVTPQKQRRSLDKKPRLETEEGSEGDEANGSPVMKRRGQPRKVQVNNTGTQDTSNGILAKPRRGRGRPRKIVQERDLVTDGSQPVKRGRGRPKGSLNKKPPAYKLHVKVGRPQRSKPGKGKRGRPRLQPAKRGRPRKYPLPSPEELKKPKVWKPLGRPRKYPRADTPEGTPPTPRRSRGRPRKSESKKGAHLRKSLPVSSSSPRTPTVGSPRKRGRPPSAQKTDAGTPRKRGRPKGSVNKNKVRSETQLDSALNHSKAKNESTLVGVEQEGELVEGEMEHDGVLVEEEVEQVEEEVQQEEEEVEQNTETSIDQDASFEVSNQA